MKETLRLFTYIVRSDCGLAPNTTGDYCTLAVCKPQIRLHAAPGDWIIGLSPKHLDYRLVYAMRVSEKLSFGEFFQDSIFEIKKPTFVIDDLQKIMGDNFYKPTGDTFIQLPSLHSHPDGSENSEKKLRDLSGKYVLAGTEYFYYGNSGETLPHSLDYLLVGRGHRSQFTQPEIFRALRHIDTLLPGVQGKPRDLDTEVQKIVPRASAIHYS